MTASAASRPTPLEDERQRGAGTEGQDRRADRRRRRGARAAAAMPGRREGRWRRPLSHSPPCRRARADHGGDHSLRQRGAWRGRCRARVQTRRMRYIGPTSTIRLILETDVAGLSHRDPGGNHYRGPTTRSVPFTDDAAMAFAPISCREFARAQGNRGGTRYGFAAVPFGPGPGWLRLQDGRWPAGSAESQAVG